VSADIGDQSQRWIAYRLTSSLAASLSCWALPGAARQPACVSSPGWKQQLQVAWRIARRDVTNVPPAARGVSMVFQSYALFRI